MKKNNPGCGCCGGITVCSECSAEFTSATVTLGSVADGIWNDCNNWNGSYIFSASNLGGALCFEELAGPLISASGSPRATRIRLTIRIDGSDLVFRVTCWPASGLCSASFPEAQFKKVATLDVAECQPPTTHTLTLELTNKCLSPASSGTTCDWSSATCSLVLS